MLRSQGAKSCRRYVGRWQMPITEAEVLILVPTCMRSQCDRNDVGVRRRPHLAHVTA
jgi:hypothetical protein